MRWVDYGGQSPVKWITVEGNGQANRSETARRGTQHKNTDHSRTLMGATEKRDSATPSRCAWDSQEHPPGPWAAVSRVPADYSCPHPEPHVGVAAPAELSHASPTRTAGVPCVLPGRVDLPDRHNPAPPASPPPSRPRRFRPGLPQQCSLAVAAARGWKPRFAPPFAARLRAPSSSMRWTAYVMSNASFSVAIPGDRAPAPTWPRTPASRGESSGGAKGVGGGGGAGAALHQGCARNSSMVYRCAGSTHSKCVIRSFAT